MSKKTAVKVTKRARYVAPGSPGMEIDDGPLFDSTSVMVGASSGRALFGGVERITPRQNPILANVSVGFTSIVQIARDILINPDLAFRTNRKLSDQMLRDPMVWGPFDRRMLAVSKLPWQILPDDEKDPQQRLVAETIDRIIRNMPKQVGFFRALLRADFRGTGVSEIDWKQDPRTNEWVIGDHRPHHGDKITYDIHGKPHMLTRFNQTGGVALTEDDLSRLVIHNYDQDDGSFYEGAEAGYVFKGHGLRDLIWQYWWLKHEALRFWLNFLERYGSGFAFGRYPQENAAAKTAIESVLKNMMNDSRISIPVPAGLEDKETFGIELQKMPGVTESGSLFREFVEDWAGNHIRLTIEGQSQTTQDSGDGLGSGRAQALQGVFRAVRDHSAGCLEDTLTQNFLPKIQLYNFGDLPFKCRFAFILDQDDYEQAEKRVKAAKDAGMAVPKTWAYETLGIPIPQDDDEVLDFGAMKQQENEARLAGMNGGGATGNQAAGSRGLFGGPHDDGGDETDDLNSYRDSEHVRHYKAALAGVHA